MLSGKKTYLVAFGGLLIAAGEYLTGQVPADQAIQLAITALLAMALRHGIGSAK